jgi:hypothetical protein
MNGSSDLLSRYSRLGLAAILVACGACGCASRNGASNGGGGNAAPVQTIPPLSADDVSILFPAPTRAGDLANLIAVRDLTTPDPRDAAKRDPVWPETVFQQFLGIAASPAAQVAGTTIRIGLPAPAQSIGNWYVAGIRVDAGAPGLSDDIHGQFGQTPEIRLIVQPVTRNADGTPKVLDIAGHLIFDFSTQGQPAQTGCSPRRVPDLQTFKRIVADVAAMRTKLANGQLGADKVTTSGVPLGTHPGLADATTASDMRQEIILFLQKYISANPHLDAMAIAGLPNGAPAPWIFLSMVEVPPDAVPSLPNGGFIPVNGPTLDGQQFAQMFQPVAEGFQVVPSPHTNNLNAITCKNAAVPANPPIADRRGVATAAVFVNPAPPPDQAKAILDVIADPVKSHFFNTDCVSCHTETQRAIDILKPADIPGIDPAALPKDPWNVRNFGWSPAGELQATVTRRTAAETAAVVAYINSELLAKR